MYDTLMKSGNFTAAQNKIDKGEFIDSISELVSICEKEGFIPRFYIEEPNDKVDETLADFKDYTYHLVTEEMNLGNLIENAVKQMSEESSRAEDTDEEDEELTLDNVDKVITDDDFEDFNEFIEGQEANDEETYKEIIEHGIK